MALPKRLNAGGAEVFAGDAGPGVSIWNGRGGTVRHGLCGGSGMGQALASFVKDQSGVTGIEYTLIAAVVLVTTMSAMTVVGVKHAALGTFAGALG